MISKTPGTSGAGALASRDSQLAWTVVLAFLAALVFPLSKGLAGLQDGDGILTSLISTQKLTWYFWGQDRLLNLIPALAAPIRNPESNLHLQLFLRAFMSLLAPAGVLAVFTRPVRNVLIATTGAQLIFAFTLGGAALFNIYAQHNPFSSSLVMFGLSSGLLLNKKGAMWALLAIVIGLVGYLTNIALIVFTLPFIALCAITAVRPRKQLLLLGAAQILMVAIAYVHAWRYGEHVTSFGVQFSREAMIAGWTSVASHVRLWPMGILLAFASLAAWKVRSREALTAWLVAVGMPLAITAMSNLAWLQLNAFDIRYYLVFVLIFATCCAYLIAAAIPWRGAMERFAPGVGAIFLIATFFIGLQGLSPEPGELIAPRWRDQSIDTAKIAVREHASLIVGDFWDVWPAVFMARTYLRDEGHANYPLYGGAFRGHVLRRKIMNLIRQQGTITSVCFQSEVDDCIRTTDFFITGEQPVKLVPGSLRKVTEGGRSLLVYQITSRNS